MPLPSAPLGVSAFGMITPPLSQIAPRPVPFMVVVLAPNPLLFPTEITPDLVFPSPIVVEECALVPFKTSVPSPFLVQATAPPTIPLTVTVVASWLVQDSAAPNVTPQLSVRSAVSAVERQICRRRSHVNARGPDRQGVPRIDRHRTTRACNFDSRPIRVGPKNRRAGP